LARGYAGYERTPELRVDGVLRSSPVCHPEETRGAAPSLGLINGMGLGRWGSFEQVVTLSRRFALITFDVGERDACWGLP
jgi:hypothetical protein